MRLIITLLMLSILITGCNDDIYYQTPVKDSIEFEVIIESEVCIPDNYEILFDGEVYTYRELEFDRLSTQTYSTKQEAMQGAVNDSYINNADWVAVAVCKEEL